MMQTMIFEVYLIIEVSIRYKDILIMIEEANSHRMLSSVFTEVKLSVLGKMGSKLHSLLGLSV